jgi:ABC-2 type transport system ATP-binding protein
VHCLQTHQLVHRFSNSETVLNNINLQVAEGSIYGFLGPNGAGKTTTFRLILGLLKKQEGEISFFGKPFEENRVSILRKIGCLIEYPSLYGHLTAVENLILLQKIYQCPKKNIDDVLTLVGLTNTGKKKTGQFSLGMKQRLGIAMALLHQPSLLILDEPSNGLDPKGMLEMRELLRKLNQERGITIVISSHLLSEIEKLVSHIGIIHHGNLMFQGTLDELKTTQLHESVMIETNNIEITLKIISDNHFTATVENDVVILPSLRRKDLARINQQLVTQGIEVYEMRTQRNDLESIFMNLINR